ncbi:TetR/AcrR family transcriptional regulator [Nocardia brasiliensis]|uniref:TetR/AcrR family transcriptional regulator n=1 Tax=Nocardia brasiliensis TaxID=37326 RepID=UPI0004A6E6F2|nr:TetR/AcrR family transcriptional regulator [Nocardia brasiliensis]MBF6124471.1 TetR/AcrR family transcriptional regulator [Nocardia brasiliensis]MBF6546304.1 TetR/AcrR family transcriptional regulator [Nocardia brasiliensis]
MRRELATEATARVTGGTAGPSSGFADRHRAARDAVLVSQRGRLIEAMVECVDCKGYSATTLTDIVARARVSRSTFYEHFANKEQCFVEAVHTGVDIVASRIAEELAQLAPDADAAARIESIVVTFCETVATEPDFARLILVESFKVNQQAVDYRDLAVDRFAELYRIFYHQARQADPALPALSDELIALIPDAIGERTRRVIIAQGPAHVPALAPLFIEFVTTTLAL